MERKCSCSADDDAGAGAAREPGKFALDTWIHQVAHLNVSKHIADWYEPLKAQSRVDANGASSGGRSLFVLREVLGDAYPRRSQANTYSGVFSLSPLGNKRTGAVPVHLQDAHVSRAREAATWLTYQQVFRPRPRITLSSGSAHASHRPAAVEIAIMVSGHRTLRAHTRPTSEQFLPLSYFACDPSIPTLKAQIGLTSYLCLSGRWRPQEFFDLIGDPLMPHGLDGCHRCSDDQRGRSRKVDVWEDLQHLCCTTGLRCPKPSLRCTPHLMAGRHSNFDAFSLSRSFHDALWAAMCVGDAGCPSWRVVLALPIGSLQAACGVWICASSKHDDAGWRRRKRTLAGRDAVVAFGQDRSAYLGTLATVASAGACRSTHRRQWFRNLRGRGWRGPVAGGRRAHRLPMLVVVMAASGRRDCSSIAHARRGGGGGAFVHAGRESRSAPGGREALGTARVYLVGCSGWYFAASSHIVG
ncbi:hypothetical protein C8R47DRAFT_1073370 [Mycena vitilis]|nr:hypothetical protein C8R47DRAFT_1073370 [Mycena vitilis]